MFAQVDIPATLGGIGVVIVALTGLVTVAGGIWLKKIGADVKETKAELSVVHEKVNGGQTQLLKTVAVTARLLAESSKKPVHFAEADAAEQRYATHLLEVKAQAEADAKRRSDAEAVIK